MLITQLYREMSPVKKWKLLGDAIQMGRQLAMAGLRQLHPQANEDEIQCLWAKQYLGEELYKEVYGDRDE
ncbi:MAG: hypothetical protein ACYSOF_07890 [Planctomycetota bacterium]|jgi:hypothetical protein